MMSYPGEHLLHIRVAESQELDYSIVLVVIIAYD
jgi:hypothetical protein